MDDWGEKYPWTIECFLEDLFLGGQSSIILVNRRLSVKFLPDIQDFSHNGSLKERNLREILYVWNKEI